MRDKRRREATAPLRRLAVVAAAVTAAGCSSAPARFYTLGSTATARDATRTHLAVLVGPVSVPAAVDRPEFVVQVAPNRVDINEFNRWVAPLGDGIAHALAGDLATLLGTPDVAVAPLANFNPEIRVTIDVQRFESVQAQSVLIDAVWTVHRTSSGATRSGRTIARGEVQGPGFEALAAAHSRAIGKIALEVAAAIRAMPKGR